MRACLVVTVRDEAPYILEWVAYHRVIGFTDIIVFQNDSTDFTHQILRQLQATGAIAYRYNSAVRGRHQVRAYKRATKLEEYLSSDWIMALDIDEFLHIRVGRGHLTDLVATAGDADQILVNWKRFGSGTQLRIIGGLVTRRFVLAEWCEPITTELRPFKTLFRRKAFDRPGIHKARRFRDSYEPRAP